MSIFDIIMEKLGVNPRTEKWYRDTLLGLLFEHRRLSKEIEHDKSPALRGKLDELESQIRGILIDMRHHEIKVPTAYLTDYPELLEIGDQVMPRG